MLLFRNAVLCWIYIFTVAYIQYVLAAETAVRSCSLSQGTSADTIKFTVTTNSPVISTADTITFITSQTFTSLGSCTHSLPASSSLTVVTNASGMVVTVLTAEQLPSTLTITCMAAPLALVETMPTVGTVRCQDTILLEVQSNPFINERHPFKLSVMEYSYPGFRLVTGSKIVLRHAVVTTTFMKGYLELSDCSCATPTGVLIAISHEIFEDMFIITLNEPTAPTLDCTCTSLATGLWGTQTLMLEVQNPSGNALFRSQPLQYIHPSSEAVNNIDLTPPVSPAGLDLALSGLPSFAFTLVDQNNNPVFSNGAMSVSLFPLTHAGLAHTPQIISPHSFAVKFNSDGVYNIPSGMVRFAGFSVPENSELQIELTIIPGVGLSVTPTATLTHVFPIPLSARLPPVPLHFPTPVAGGYVTVQRSHIWRNMPSLDSQLPQTIEDVSVPSPLGTYTPTLYLPQHSATTSATAVSSAPGIGAYDASGTPRPRLLAAEAKSVNQRRVYSVGGQVLQSSQRTAPRREDAVLMDVWVYDIVAGAHRLLYGSQHTLGMSAVKGGSGEFDHAFHPAARHSAAAAVDVDERYLYLHGGCADVQCTRIFNDLWVFDVQEHMWAYLVGAVTAFADVAACNTAYPLLYGHKMAMPGRDISQTQPSLVNDVNFGLQSQDVLYVFGGATHTPTNKDGKSFIGRHFASNAMFKYTINFDRNTSPVEIRGANVMWVSGDPCATSDKPSQGEFYPLKGLTRAQAEEKKWTPPAAVYAAMVYDPYRQVLWLYGGMHASYAYDAADASTHDSPAHGRRGTSTNPLMGDHTSGYFPLGDSGALSWLWKYVLASDTWVLVSTSDGCDPGLGRGAPRLAFNEKFWDGTIDDTILTYNHPGGRVLPALAVDKFNVYLSGGLGHTLGAVLPGPPGRADSFLQISADAPPRTNMHPLAFGMPPDITEPLFAAYTMHSHMLYSEEMLLRAGLRPGMSLHGVEVLVKLHDDLTHTAATLSMTTGVRLWTQDTPDWPTEQALYELMQDVPLTNDIAYQQLRQGKWMSVGVHRGDKDHAWTGGYLVVSIVHKFLSGQPFLLPAESHIFGAEMRTVAPDSAYTLYYQDNSLWYSGKYDAIATIALRSPLMPVYNPLQMALPLAYSPYNPHLDDSWFIPVGDEAFHQSVPPKVHRPEADVRWYMSYGYLVPAAPSYAAAPATATDWSAVPQYTIDTHLGARAGAVMLVPQPYNASVHTTDFLVNYFLMGGFQAHAERSQYFPGANADTLPRMPPRDGVPASEVTVYDDVWTSHATDKCLSTRFSYTCMCSSPSSGIISTLVSSTLLSPPLHSACVDVCADYDCGAGTCLNAGGRAQCVCNGAVGVTYDASGTVPIFCSAVALQLEATTDDRFAWTVSLPIYSPEKSPLSPGTRFGAATTVDNGGCVWLYGGMAPSGMMFRDLWRHCAADNQWTRIWAATLPTVSLTAPYSPSSATPYETLPTVVGEKGEPGVSVKGVLFFQSRGTRHPITGRPLLDEDTLVLLTSSPVQYPSVWEYTHSTGTWRMFSRYTYALSSPTNFLSASNIGEINFGYAPGSWPGVREAAATATQGEFVWLFSGGALLGTSDVVLPYHLDLWVYNSTSHLWALKWGRKVVTEDEYKSEATGSGLAAPSVVARAGKMGEFAATNSPGCRVGAAAAMSPDGRFFYLHGGVRPSSQAQLFFNGDISTKAANLGYYGLEVLQDLWVYDSWANMWAWLGGSLEPLSPRSHAGTYVSRSPNDLNTPPPRFLHSMAIGTDGYLRLDRGLTVEYVFEGDAVKSERLRPLQDMFMLYLPPLTRVSGSIVLNTLQASGLSAAEAITAAAQMRLPGTLSHIVGKHPTWMTIFDSPATAHTPSAADTGFARGHVGQDFVLEPAMGHTLLMAPGPVLLERAVTQLPWTPETLAEFRRAHASRLYKQFTLSVSGVTCATDVPIQNAVAPFVSPEIMKSGSAFSYTWGAPCRRTLCLNGGACVPGNTLFNDDASMHCTCPRNFFGSVCQHSFCDLFPCRNGGNCTVTMSTTDTSTPCQCPKNFSGRFCEINTFLVAPMVDVNTGAVKGPGYHFMAATASFDVLMRDVAMLQLPPGSHASVISGGHVARSSTRYQITDANVAVSSSTWLYSDATNTMIDLMKLLADHYDYEYSTPAPGGPILNNGEAPWGNCMVCSHFGARLGHSIVVARDNSVSRIENPVIYGKEPALDALVVFGGLVPRPMAFQPAGTIFSDQLWQVNLGTGMARLMNGVTVHDWTSVPATDAMAPEEYESSLGVQPRHEYGTTEFKGRHPSARAHHVAQVVQVAGKSWMYLYGGFGGDSLGNVGVLGDLWRLDLDRYKVSPGESTVFETNPRFLHWQYIGCSVSHHGYVFDAERVAVGEPVHVSPINLVPNTLSVGCPSARAHAASSVDTHGRIWVVGGVGARGPLDDVWVYDPTVGALGAWHKIQGTVHSGTPPISLTAASAGSSLLKYVYSLVGGGADPSTFFKSQSYTITATYAELGAGCVVGTACPMVSAQTHTQYRNGDDVSGYAPDHTRIGAVVGAAATTTEAGMVLYGGLTRTRTYIPLFDQPSQHVLSLPALQEVHMPLKLGSVEGKLYLFYTADDLTHAGIKAGDNIPQLALGLDTPMSGIHTISFGFGVGSPDDIVQYVDNIHLQVVGTVSATSGHVSGDYLTLSGLPLGIPNLDSTGILALVVHIQRLVPGTRSTLLSCSRISTDTDPTPLPLADHSLLTLLENGRMAVSRKDPDGGAGFTDHTFLPCAPALRLSTRNVAHMGPSNLLWSIDTSQPNQDLAKTHITLISGAMPHMASRARYGFLSSDAVGGSDPSGPQDIVAGIGYAYTHGLHAGVAEVGHDWVRRDSMLSLSNFPAALGSSTLLLHQMGYPHYTSENLSFPENSAMFDPLLNYPAALAFGSLFKSSRGSVYMLGGVSTLQMIDSQSNPSPLNTLVTSAASHTYPLPVHQLGAATVYGNPHIYSFGEPVPPRPFTARAPKLLSATFSADFATITILFDVDTNAPSSETVYNTATCARVLDDASLAVITAKSKCAWAARRRFSIQLHESHNARQGVLLGIRAVTVYDTEGVLPSVPTTVALAVEVPSVVSAVITPVKDSAPCQSLLLSGAASKGAYGRRLLYQWQLQRHDTLDNTEQIAAFDAALAALPADAQCAEAYPGLVGVCTPELRFNAAGAAAILLPGYTSTFTLTVHNRFGDHATATTSIARADDPAPTVTVERFQYRKEFSAPLLLAATVTASRCPLAPAIVRRSLGIAWTLESGTHAVNFTDANEVVLNGYNLVMVPYGLLPGTYTFTATVTETHYNALGVARRLPTTTAPITVDIFTTAPTATLTGAVDRTVSLRYLRNGILARDLAVPNVVYAATSGSDEDTGEDGEDGSDSGESGSDGDTDGGSDVDPSQPQPVVTLSAVTSADPAANPAISSPLLTLQFAWQCHLSDGTTPCFSALTTADRSLATLPADTHTLHIAASTLEALSLELAEGGRPHDYLVFTMVITRKIDGASARASSWLRVDRTTDISVSLSLSSPHTTTSTALIHSQPHDMVVSAALSSSTTAAEDPDAVVPVLRWYSDPPLNFTDIALALSRPAHTADLVIPSARLLPNTRYTFYVHLFDMADAPPADAYLDTNGVPVSTSSAFATTSLAVFVQDFPTLGECELTTLGPYAPMASMDLQTLNATVCESGLCRMRAACRDWPEDAVFEWMLQTGDCAGQGYEEAATTASTGMRDGATHGRNRGYGHRGVASITDSVRRGPLSGDRAAISGVRAQAAEARCEDMVQIAPGTAASAIHFVANIDTPAHVLVRVSLSKAVRYVSLPLPAPADEAVTDSAAVLAEVVSVLDEVEFGPGEDDEDEDTSNNHSNSQTTPLTRVSGVPQRVGRVRTNGVLGAGATATVSATAEVSAEQLQVLLSGATLINTMLVAPDTSSPVAASSGAPTAALRERGVGGVSTSADMNVGADTGIVPQSSYTRQDLLLLQQRVLRVLTSNATNLATYGAMSPTHSTAQDLINSDSSSSSSVVSEATLRAIAAPCTNPTTAYARVHCTDALVRAFTAYSARNIQEGVPTEVADSVLQRLAAIHDNFNATTLALSSARVLKPYTLADYAIDPASLSATPQRTSPLPEDGSLTEADTALQRAHWEAVRISQQLLAAAKIAAFGDVALRQPESPPRLLVSDSISVLVDAQYVSAAPTSIALGSGFSVTLPADLPGMLAEPAADPFVSGAHTSQGRHQGMPAAASARDAVDIEQDAPIAIDGRVSLDNTIDVPTYKQQLCASHGDVTQTLHHVLAAYCNDVNTQPGTAVNTHVLATTVGGLTATRTAGVGRHQARAYAALATRGKTGHHSRLGTYMQAAEVGVEGLVPVTAKGTTLTKTLTSIISTAPALMRLVSADNRNDTHVASSSVVDVTMYNHTDAGRRDLSVDAMGIAQVQPLQWKPTPPADSPYVSPSTVHAAVAGGDASAPALVNTTASPVHFYFTFALPELAKVRWSKLKKKPLPRCQFFLPTALTDGVTAVEDDGTGTGTGGDANVTLSAPTVGEWSTEGCELVNVTATHATCKCSHLTYFRISFSLDDLFPSINLLSWADFANLTWANLMKYPAPLITCLVWLGALCALVAVAWVFDIYYDKRGLVELAEQWNKVMIASTDLSYVPSRAVVLDYKRYGLPQSPKDFDMCEYMLLSQYDQLGQWYVDVDALSVDQRQRKAAMKARAATVRANDADALAAAKAAVAAAQEEMRIEEGDEEEDDEMAMFEDAGAAEPTEVMVVLPEQLEDTHSDTAPAVEVAEVDVDIPAITPTIPEEEEAASDEQEQQNEELVPPSLPIVTEEAPLEPVVEEESIYPAAEDVDEDDEEYDVVDDDVFDAMYPNTDTASTDTPDEAPAAMVVETMSEDDLLIHSTAFDAPAAPRRPGRLTISRSAYNERMKAKAKAKPPGQHALLQNRLFAAPYYAGAIIAPSTTTAFDANDAGAVADDDATTGTDGPLANPPPPPAHSQPGRGSVAALRRPTTSYPATDSTTSKRASVSAYPAASSATSKRASVSNAAYPGATSTTGRRSIATVPYAAVGLADEGAPVFVTMTSVEAGMDSPYAKDTGRGSVGAPPGFYASKSVDAAVYRHANNAGRRASVVPPRLSLFSRPAFARPLTLRASVIAPESKAAVAASTRATFPLLTLPPPRPPAGQSDWREVGSTFGEKMKSDHPLLTLFLRSPTDDITFTGHVVMLMLMVLSGLAISAFFTENAEHEIIKDFIVGLITACLLMPVMVVLRYAIVENNHQRLVGFLQWYAELCCFLRYEQVKLLHLGLEAAVPFGDGDEELVSMIKTAIRRQRIEERERKEKELRLQHSGVGGEAGVEMASMATGTSGTGNTAGRGDVEAGGDVSGKEDGSGDESDADREVSTFTPAHTRCECCNSTISCSFNALPSMYRLQLLPHSAYEQIATVAQMGEAALQRVPCRGEVEMREEQLLNELALLGAWDDLLAARAQDKNSVRVAVNKVQWREWLRWAEDTSVALGDDEDDAGDAITTTFNTTNSSTHSASTTATKSKRPVHDKDEEEDSSLLYNREEAAYRAELLQSRVDWTRSIGLSSGDADDETDVSDVVWIDTGVTPAGDATATALAITAAAAKTRKARKTTVPAPASTASADVPLSHSIAASLCPAPALGWGIAPGLGGVPNENESVTVDTTFTMQHLPALDEQAAQHYGNMPSPANSAYNYANGPTSPRASAAPLPASPRSSNAAAVAAVPVIEGAVMPGSPRVSSASTAAAPRGSPSVSRAHSTIAPKTANPALSLLHDPLPQLPVAVTAQRHNHIPSSAAVPLSPLPPPNPLVCPGPSLVQTSATARAQLLAALRQHTRIHIPHLLRFYDAYMPVMPRSVKGKLSVAFLVFWALLCGFLVVVYGLQFDMAAAEAGGEDDGFDIGKDEGEAESAAEWILNGLFGVALELMLYAPLLLLLDACVEARVQKKRERERAAWEYEQAAAIFNDTLQPSDDADAPEDADIHLQGSSSANGTGTGASCAEVEMVDMRVDTRAAAGDVDNGDEPAFATYPLASPVAPPLPLPSLAPPSSSASTSTEALTSPAHTSSAPCSPTPNTSLARTASSSPPNTNPIRRTSSTTSSTAAGPSRSMERYRSLTERPDLTSADQRLMAVLQRMQIDFAPHRFFAAAALEYPLESAFPILGHMRADTFLRLCANKMKWSAATASGTGVRQLKTQTGQNATAVGGKPAAGSTMNGTTASAAGDAKAAPVVARVGDGSSLSISGVSWLNDKHSKRHQRKKQSDARTSKTSISSLGLVQTCGSSDDSASKVDMHPTRGERSDDTTIATGTVQVQMKM